MTGEDEIRKLGKAISALCRAYRVHLEKGRPKISFDELLQGLERDIREHGYDLSILAEINQELFPFTDREMELSRIWRALNSIKFAEVEHH